MLALLSREYCSADTNRLKAKDINDGSSNFLKALPTSIESEEWAPLKKSGGDVHPRGDIAPVMKIFLSSPTGAAVVDNR